MALDLESFLVYARAEVPKCPEPVLEDAVVFAVRAFAVATEILNDSCQVDTVANTGTVALAVTDPETEVHRVTDILLTDASGNQKYLIAANRNRGNSAQVVTSTPTYYWLNTNGTVNLWPIPDTVYTLSVFTIVKPKYTPPTADAPITPPATFNDAFAEWLEGIAAYAKFWVQRQVAQPWGDTAAAKDNLAFYISERGKARRLVNISRGGNGVRVMFPSFGA